MPVNIITRKAWDRMQTRGADREYIRPTVIECRATQLTPAWHLLPDENEVVALDIEFQNYKGPKDIKFHHRVGRVAIVNTRGETVLDCYAQYPFVEGVEIRTPPAEFNVTRRDLTKAAKAVSALKVEMWVKEIVTGRTVVLHGGKHDLTAFMLVDGVFDGVRRICDTQKMYKERFAPPASLAHLAEWQLGRIIQRGGGHTPVEDAQATMDLYLLKKREQQEAREEAERLEEARRNGDLEEHEGGVDPEGYDCGR